jgi:phosphoribosylaminoimidazolecarboxamide formyltransferase/IMP cyclohydrolase
LKTFVSLQVKTLFSCFLINYKGCLMTSYRNALISVSNKKGVETLARGLIDMGFTIIATSGTAGAISNAGLKVTGIEDFVGAADIMKCKIRTIQPKIHAGIVAVEHHGKFKQLKHIHAEPIDFVIVNLYPFESVLASFPENNQKAFSDFDLGGPALIRSAVKNFSRVTVVSSPDDYETVLWHIAKNNKVPLAMKKQLAIKALAHVADYDKAALDALSELEVEID